MEGGRKRGRPVGSKDKAPRKRAGAGGRKEERVVKRAERGYWDEVVRGVAVVGGVVEVKCEGEREARNARRCATGAIRRLGVGGEVVTRVEGGVMTIRRRG